MGKINESLASQNQDLKDELDKYHQRVESCRDDVRQFNELVQYLEEECRKCEQDANFYKSELY